MFNSVILSGRLTQDPELKTTTTGKSVTSFSVAVDRAYKADGEKITDFLNIVAWGSTAEFVTRYFRKENLIGIEGSVETRKYQDKNGDNRTAFEIVAKEAHFLERKKEE